MTTFAFVAGMIPLIVVERHRIRHQSRDRLHHLRRPVAGAAADAARHAGGVFIVRRSGARPDVQARRRARRTIRRCSRRCNHADTVRLAAPRVRPRRIGVRADLAQRPRPHRRPHAATLQLTVDEAVKMALDQNVDLSAARLDPQISDTRVAAAVGAFKPTLTSSVQQNNQLQPPASFLIPTATRTDVVTSSAGVAQRVPWFGTRTPCRGTPRTPTATASSTASTRCCSRGWPSACRSRCVRDLVHRRRRASSSRPAASTATSPTRVCARRMVHTTADVKAAYWNLVSAHATVDARRSALRWPKSWCA